MMALFHLAAPVSQLARYAIACITCLTEITCLLFVLCPVSENKVLCHPSSVDSLSTSAATEDHVSMGGWAARKALRVVEHVELGTVC